MSPRDAGSLEPTQVRLVLEIGTVELTWAPVGDSASRRAVADRLCAGVLGVDARIVRLCTRCGGDHGPPRLAGHPDRPVSLGYAGGFVFVSVGESGLPALGLDAEVDDAAARRAAREAIGSDARTWTRLEASVKALRSGLEIAPERVRASGAPNAWTASVDGVWCVRGVDVPAPPGLLLSLGWVDQSAGGSDGSSGSKSQASNRGRRA